jgi:hypothetical protein
VRVTARLLEAIVAARSDEAEASTMADKIIPLQPNGNRPSALARFDRLAAELLSDGQAATLTAARIDAVLKQTREDRTKLAALLEDLQARSPTGNTQLDKANADLCVSVVDGIAHIDMLIRAIEQWRPDASTEDLSD